MKSLEIDIYDEGKLAYRTSLKMTVEFGRQNIDEKAPYAQHQGEGLTRVVIARLDEVTIPRKLLKIEQLEDGRARLTNLSRIPLRLDVGPPLETGTVRDVGVPVSISVGDKVLSLRSPDSEVEGLHSLPDSSFCPAADPAASILLATTAKDQINEGKLDNEQLLRWITAAQQVLQGASGSSDSFFRRAARALVDLVGLDFGCVLLNEKGRWVVHQEGRAGHVWSNDPRTSSTSDWQPSQQVLDNVLRQKKTFWQKLDAESATDSLLGVKSVVASPILSPANAVIGVLYGERRRTGPQIKPISRLVAMLVELLAGGVAAGLTRLEQEKNLFLWEQFVTPDLSRHIAENPRLLDGRDAEVTMLSCDIRGFSRICNNLGPARTLEWVQDVLGTLSDCALKEEGVLVDYVGDELLAMWGAPGNQPDHAPRACRAALNMLASVTALNAKWIETVKEPMGLAIGINSGTARVGNVGSARKFKYGALGTTVNLTSRIQGATKFLKVPILVTRAVQDRVDRSFRTRRLCQVKVVNLDDPVPVYQLSTSDHASWDVLRDTYEQALSQFEAQEYRAAARSLGGLLAQPAHKDDFPSQVLLMRATTYMVQPPKQFDPVWELPGK